MLNKIACLFSGRIPLNSSFLLTFYMNNKYPVSCPMPDPTKSYRLSFALCRDVEDPWEKKKAEDGRRNQCRMLLQK